MSTPPPRIAFCGITRTFGSHVANDDISIAIARGSVHAFLGGNGAGKSTLMRMLQGLERPDGGQILLDGAPVSLSGAHDAIARGIGMVHQEFSTIPELSLLDNLILGHEPRARLGRVDRARALHEAEALAAMAGMEVDWSMPTAHAPLHVRQGVEILRVLYRGADVLILDEPSAVLPREQIAGLLRLMRRLRDEGRTLIFISHKLDEVMAVADRASILRDGRHVATLERADMSHDALVRHMTGRPPVPARVPDAQRGEVVLSVRDLSLRDRRGTRRVDGLSFDLHAGEILGLGGVPGAGQDEVLRCVAGLCPCDGGQIALRGRAVERLSTRARRRAGIGYLSAERAGESLCLDASLRDNVVAGRHDAMPFAAWGLRRDAAITGHTRALLDRFGVRRATDLLASGRLSGGNQQRVAMARELDARPCVLLVAQPTRGVDLEGIDVIHHRIVEFAAAGGAVLLVSEEEDELRTLSTRLLALGAVVTDGGIGGHA